ncbi:MAG TPA: EamA family transporter [Candidatus Binatia bacterium]|nr:EamA family transporter [Candidatus Binatia bacterium]
MRPETAVAPAEDRSPATYASFAVMCLVWGSTFLAIRIGNESVAPVWSAVVRLSIATPLYFLIALLSRAPWPRGAALGAALLYGFLNYGLNFALLYRGEVQVSSGTASILYATIPLITVIAVARLGLQRLRSHEIWGALIGLAGVALVFSGELSGGGPPLALAAVFVGAIAAALSAVALKLGPPQSTWPANALGSAVGLAVCCAVSLALGERWTLPRGTAGWAPILYLIATGNLIAYALFGWLLTKWKVTSVNAMSLVIPVIAVFLGAAIRAEAPGPGTILGAALVLAGVSLTLFVGRR